MTRNAFARPALIAVATMLVAGSAAPALARGKGPATVTMSAKSLDNANGRLCMPKTTLGNKATKEMPDTLCQTRSDWEAQGVTFKVK